MKLTPERAELIVRFMIAAAIIMVAVGGFAALRSLESGC